jgi:hypothetical protein
MYPILRMMIYSDQFLIFLSQDALRTRRFNRIYKGTRPRLKITGLRRVIKCHNAAKMVAMTETCYSAHITFNTVGGKNILQLVNTCNLFSPCEIQ